MSGPVPLWKRFFGSRIAGLVSLFGMVQGCIALPSLPENVGTWRNWIQLIPKEAAWLILGASIVVGFLWGLVRWGDRIEATWRALQFSPKHLAARVLRLFGYVRVSHCTFLGLENGGEPKQSRFQTRLLRLDRPCIVQLPRVMEAGSLDFRVVVLSGYKVWIQQIPDRLDQPPIPVPERSAEAHGADYAFSQVGIRRNSPGPHLVMVEARWVGAPAAFEPAAVA